MSKNKNLSPLPLFGRIVVITPSLLIPCITTFQLDALLIEKKLNAIVFDGGELHFSS